MYNAHAVPLNKILTVWTCGSDGCLWQVEPPAAQYAWILDRGDGKPAANVVSLAFVNPLALLHQTTDTLTTKGIPIGMTANVVKAYADKGITVFASLGGASYAALWDFALVDPVTLAKNAAALAKQLNVGIEIDYEDDAGISYASAMDTFVKTYRSIIPYDSSANPPVTSLLTVDAGAGTGYLQIVSQWSSTWLANNQINWIYAMVANAPWTDISQASPYWQQHLSGDAANKINPVAPSQLVVSVSAENNINCKTYSGSVLEGAVGWVSSKNSRGVALWQVGCVNACVGNCTAISTASKSFY